MAIIGTIKNNLFNLTKKVTEMIILVDSFVSILILINIFGTFLVTFFLNYI